MRITGWNISPEETKLRIETDRGKMQIYGIMEDIFRCVYTKEEEIKEESAIGIHVTPAVKLSAEQSEGTDCLRITGGNLVLDIDMKCGRFSWFRRSERSAETAALL